MEKRAVPPTGLTDAFGVRWTRALLEEVMDIGTPASPAPARCCAPGDEIVAVHAGMRSKSVLHWWFPTYDPRYAAYSPGIILLLRIAAALGSGKIDLGKGDARYKRSLMTGAAPLREGCVELPSLAAAVRRLTAAPGACAASSAPGGSIDRRGRHRAQRG